MRHLASRAFWDAYEKLPAPGRELADKNYAPLKEDPQHASLRLRKLGVFGLRALAFVTAPWRWNLETIWSGFGSGPTPITTHSSGNGTTRP